MGKRVYALSIIWLALQSCATSDGLKTTALSERNVSNLARLNLGMTESQVLCIMRDPYRQEVFHSSDDQYDVWFYITQPTAMSQTRMVPFNLTPLTFRNKILIGMGYDYYHWLQNQSVRHKGYMPQPQPQKKEENKIEESIQNSFSRDEVSMSSPKSKPPEAASEPAKSNPPPPQVPQKTIEIDEEDNEMIQDESDQNFNFW